MGDCYMYWVEPKEIFAEELITEEKKLYIKAHKSDHCLSSLIEVIRIHSQWRTSQGSSHWHLLHSSYVELVIIF